MITNANIIKHNRADTNQRAPFDVATVQSYAMAHRDFVFKNSWAGSVAYMNHGVILNVRAAADSNVMHIAADHCIEPNRGFLANVHIADDVGAGGNECGGVNPRFDTV